MYALFEDSGKLHSGRILSQAQASAQIELDTGKRLKVKDATVTAPATATATARLGYHVNCTPGAESAETNSWQTSS